MVRDVTAVEECVQQVWSEMLKVPVEDKEQTFFDLGGDSLLMIDMLAQLSNALGTEISPNLLFEDASFGGFSKLVSAQVAESSIANEGTF